MHVYFRGGAPTTASAFSSSPKIGLEWTRIIRNHEFFFSFLAFFLVKGAQCGYLFINIEKEF